MPDPVIPVATAQPAHLTIFQALLIGLKGLLQSRKFLIALFTMFGNLALKFGLELDVEQAIALTSPLIAAIFGQAAVDVRNAGGNKTVDVSLSAAPPASATPPSNTVVMLALFLGGAAMIAGALMSSGCTETQRAAALGALSQCAKKEIKSQADELVPAFTNNIKNAIDGTGKVDRPTLNSFAAPLRSAAARCGFDAAMALLLNPPKAADGSPQSSPFPVDSVDLAEAYNVVRAEWSQPAASP